VPEFPGAGINGVTMWHAGKPVVALTLRWKWADVFWFSFFHEAAHLLEHGKNEVFIEPRQANDRPQAELDADRFAANFLIPPDVAARWFPLLRTARGKAQLVTKLATTLRVCPGIVVGRLQHDGVIGHNSLNSLRTQLSWGARGNEN